MPQARKPNGYDLFDGPSQLDGTRIVAIAITRAGKNRKTGTMIQTYILRPTVTPIAAVHRGLDVSICGDCGHRGDGTGRGRSCYVNLGHGPTIRSESQSPWVIRDLHYREERSAAGGC